MKKQNRGVIYSIMLLLIIASMFSLFSTLREVKQDLSITSLAEINNATSTYNNLEEMFITLDKSGYGKEIINRTLPFTTTVDKNSTTFVKKLSISPSFFDETVNGINLAKIFVEDSNYERVFDGIKKNVSLNSKLTWEGQVDEITGIILPYCYSYTADANNFYLDKINTGKCIGVFDENKIRKLNLDINLNSTTSDYNTVTCNGISCSSNSFNPSNPLQYFSLTINEDFCSNCNIPITQISSHFDPSTPFDITISCVGASCKAKPITITQSDLRMVVSSTEDYVYTSQEIEFSDEVSNVIISGIDINAIYNSALKKS